MNNHIIRYTKFSFTNIRFCKEQRFTPLFKKQKILRMSEGSCSITRYYLILSLCRHFIWHDSFNVSLKTYFLCYSSYWQIIQTVKYVDNLVLMAKEETVLQGMIDKLIEIGKCYGMEMNVEKTKVMRISRQPSPVTIMIDQKQLENVEYITYLGSLLTNDGR